VKPDDFKIILDDVRARHMALVNLILFTDQKAMAVFRLYVTLGIAAAATAATGFFREDQLLQFARWPLIITAAWLAIGALYCFHAMTRPSINLPGRGPEFWEWALKPENETIEVVNAYLSELRERQQVNRKLNDDAAGSLAVAIWVGITTPAITALPAAVSILFTAVQSSNP